MAAPNDGYLRAVPSDSDPDDGRLYLDGADPPPVGGATLRTLMGVGLSWLLALMGGP